MTSLAILSLVACKKDEPVDSSLGTQPIETDTYEADDPLPYEPGLEDPTPDPSADGLDVVLEQAGEVALSYSAEPAVAGYVALMDSGADKSCPTLYDKQGASLWYESCSGKNGSFGGYAYAYFYEDESDGNYLWTGAAVNGVMSIVDDQGNTFLGEGTAQFLSGVTKDGQGFAWQSYAQGAFTWTDADPDSWVFAGDSASVGWYALHYPKYDAKALLFYGGVTIEVDEAIYAVAFDENLMADELIGSACPEEPGGTISVRDANGLWYDVVFDGPKGEDPGDASRCDGCGDVFFRDELIGTTCPDLTSWLSWEDQPW